MEAPTTRSSVRAAIAAISVLGACALPARPPRPPAPVERIAIIAAERGPSGARLVAIDERGDRRFALIAPPEGLARDTDPALSPDGRWLVFASSRARPLATTSLWLAPLAPEAVPWRLTDATAIDSHPVWSPDGRAIVFASTRANGNFDLWRLAIDPRGMPGALEQLTRGEGHEVTPTIAADGAIIYAAVSATGDDSHLEVRAPDGVISRLTDGPHDTTPSVSPDDRAIAFARGGVHPGGSDTDLWRIPRRGGAAVRVIDLPLTDESGPVWSPDGRFVFATSVLRGEAGAPVFSSVIAIDLGEPRPVARLLEDRAGAIVRLTPAITRTPLDVAALHRDPEYLPELARIVAAAVAREAAAATTTVSP